MRAVLLAVAQVVALVNAENKCKDKMNCFECIEAGTLRAGCGHIHGVSLAGQLWQALN